MTQRNYSEVAERFGLVAQKYCSLIESRSTFDRIVLLSQIYRVLPELISEGIRLLQVKFGEQEKEEKEDNICEVHGKTDMTDEELQELQSSLAEKLGDWVSYWFVFDPRQDTEGIRGSLADDVADIYRDLRSGLRLAKSNEIPPEEIVFAWRLTFLSNWGTHAMVSLRTIHSLLAEADAPARLALTLINGRDR